MFGYIIIALLVLSAVIAYLSANNYFRTWPTARLENLRAQLTMLMMGLLVITLFTGRIQFLVVILFVALPIIRNMLDPKRGVVDPKEHTKIVTGMTQEEALRILELDEDELTPEEVEKSYLRLMKLVHPDKGGTTYFAAKLNAARDFLSK